MDISITNPRRILILGPPSSDPLTLIKGTFHLTGSAPTSTTNTTAGLSHTWDIKTSYYHASVPIWIDEVPDPTAWKNDFLSDEAKEVVDVLGAMVVGFRKPIDPKALDGVKALLDAASAVATHGCGPGWDGVLLAVAMPQSTTPILSVSFEEWEDLCQDLGFEYVDVEMTGRNQFGGTQIPNSGLRSNPNYAHLLVKLMPRRSIEPVGMARVKEALEANDWAGGGDSLEGLGADELGDVDEGSGFKLEADELEREMFGMKSAISTSQDQGSGVNQDGNEDEEVEVEQMEAMMLKLRAVKDMSADLPEEQRKRVAAKAVNDIMKTM
ncbi:MAG: hypothetical protein M1833_001496 [Piccolia ochrophora]|nr:MAG: hypothetical protein M1833_001496 [Piccolia ochrophora]